FSVYSLYFKSTKFLDLRNEKMALIYFNLKKQNKNLALSNSLLKISYLFDKSDDLLNKAVESIPRDVLDMFLSFYKINESQELFSLALNCDINLLKKMTWTEFNLGNFQGMRNVSKEKLYNFLKEFLFNNKRYS
ncbi:hypothetical protein TUBRATIS_30320, partial [Tubulinosema ratisbonensis]